MSNAFTDPNVRIINLGSIRIDLDHNIASAGGVPFNDNSLAIKALFILAQSPNTP